MNDNTLNITTDQGSSLTYTFTLVDSTNAPFVLIGYDARLQIRRTYGSSIVLANCTLANSKLALGSNTVVLTLAPTDTTAIQFNSKDDNSLDCVYDLEIVSPTGKTYKPARGTFTLNREVTR